MARKPKFLEKGKGKDKERDVGKARKGKHTAAHHGSNHLPKKK